MKFEHRITVETELDQLWLLLSDVPRVASLLPGVEHVEHLGSGAYKGLMRIRLGPMGFTFAGTATVIEDRPKGSWAMKAEAQDGRMGGGVNVDIEVIINESSPGTCDLSVCANIQFLGKLGQMGQAVINHKANSMIKEFAEGLRRTVNDSHS